MRKNSAPLWVCVVMPAWKEAGLIGGVIPDAAKIFKTSSSSAEIVLVNDGVSLTTSSSTHPWEKWQE